LPNAFIPRFAEVKAFLFFVPVLIHEFFDEEEAENEEAFISALVFQAKPFRTHSFYGRTPLKDQQDAKNPFVAGASRLVPCA
jgi:hypothetical protein